MTIKNIAMVLECQEILINLEVRMAVKDGQARR